MVPKAYQRLGMMSGHMTNKAIAGAEEQIRIIV
jgi:hypothetical protein